MMNASAVPSRRSRIRSLQRGSRSPSSAMREALLCMKSGATAMQQTRDPASLFFLSSDLRFGADLGNAADCPTGIYSRSNRTDFDNDVANAIGQHGFSDAADHGIDLTGHEWFGVFIVGIRDAECVFQRSNRILVFDPTVFSKSPDEK